MAYTAATKIPPLVFFQWSRPDAPDPKLSSPIDADDTVITFSSAPKDYLGAVIAGAFLMGVKNSQSYTELIYVPAGALSTDGLTATGVVRGIRISGLDYTTGDTDFADTHEQDSPVFCSVNAVYEALLAGIFSGTIATNGLTLRLGDETDTNVTLVAAGVSDEGFLRKNYTSGHVEYSDDGAAWTSFASVSASDLVTVSAADTTPGHLSDKISVSGGIVKSITSPAGNEVLNLNADIEVAYTARAAVEAGNPLCKTTVADEAEKVMDRTPDYRIGEDKEVEAEATTFVRSCNVTDNITASVYVYANVAYVKFDKVDEFGVHTLSSSQTLGAGSGYAPDICSTEDGTTVVVSYRSSADDKVYAVALSVTVSTMAIAIGTPVEFGDDDTTADGYTSVALVNKSTPAIVVGFVDTADADKGKVRAATVTGTAIGAPGAAVEVLTTNTGDTVAYISVAYSAEDRVVVMVGDSTGTDAYYVALSVATGTALAMATEVAVATATATACKAQYIKDNYVLLAWIGTSSYVYARVASISGLTLSFPADATTVNALAAATPDIAVTSEEQAFIVYEQTAAGLGKFNVLTLNDTSITLGDQKTFNAVTGTVAYTSVAKLNSRGMVNIGYRDESTTNYFYAECFQNYSNVDYVLGFGQSAVAATESVSVRTKGVESNVTGLTAGTLYYLADLITFGGSTTQFDISEPTTDTIRYTYDTTGTDPNINAYSIKEGDMIVINGQNFTAANNGTFEVTASASTYFEITNASGVTESNKTIGTGSIKTLGISSSNNTGIKVGIGKDTTELDIAIERVGATDAPTVRTYTTTSTQFGAGDTQFDVTNPVGTTFTYTYNSTGTDPVITAVAIPIGSIVEVYIGALSAGNKGVFTVTASGADYFSVTNAAGVAEINKRMGVGYLAKRNLYTWAKPVGLSYIEVEVQAAGGGSGGGDGGSTLAAGAGGGAYSKKVMQASDLGETETIAVGAYGKGASDGLCQSDGTSGSMSIFGTHLVCTGGEGSEENTATTYGEGGSATGGDIDIDGQEGGCALNSLAGGTGGSAFLGHGGPAGGDSVGSQAGKNYGGGAGGTYDNSTERAGADGAQGIVIIKEYLS